MSKLSVYRTLSFWLCLGMAWLNLVLFFVARHLHSPGLTKLAAGTMAVSVLGAIIHWILDATYRHSHK